MKQYATQFLIFFIFICVSRVTLAQNERFIFPDDWLGRWEGELEIYNDTGLVQRVKMVIDNQRTDTVGVFTWELSYGEQDADPDYRPYLLRTLDKDKGHFVVDEQNSIFLDAYFRANKLISVFIVSGNEITSIYTRQENELVFEIIMNKRASGQISGNTSMGGEMIPEVTSYPVPVYQRAILHRVE